jgi:hypothetical protein
MMFGSSVARQAVPILRRQAVLATFYTTLLSMGVLIAFGWTADSVFASLMSVWHKTVCN